MEDTHILNTDLLEDGGSHWLFAVFDGHAGDSVARFLEDHFVRFMRAAVLSARQTCLAASDTAAGVDYCAVMREAFAATEEELRSAAGFVADDSNEHLLFPKKKASGDSSGENTMPCRARKGRCAEKDPVDLLRDAGSTAAVALVVDGKALYCANCGDSEIVLASVCHKSSAIGGEKEAGFSADAADAHVRCLTKLHKPEDELERRRIETLGGHVVQMWGNVHRAMGILAVARSFGDYSIAVRNYEDDSRTQVICSTPFVSGPHYLQCDDLLIVACDGLWDVVTYEDAAKIAKDHQKRPSESGATESGELRTHNVAHALVRAAISDRHSGDNVSVIALEVGVPGDKIPHILADIAREEDDSTSEDASETEYY